MITLESCIDALPHIGLPYMQYICTSSKYHVYSRYYILRKTIVSSSKNQKKKNTEVSQMPDCQKRKFDKTH